MLIFISARVLLSKNRLTGTVPSSLCDLRSRDPVQFKSLHADCTPNSDTLVAQNPCANGCCTECFLGVLVE